LPDYYNSGRSQRPDDRSAKDSRANRENSRSSYDESSYPMFEEGYTSGDNRGRQSRQPGSGRGDSGYSSRFIDAGDRYMRGFEEDDDSQQTRKGRSSSGRRSEDDRYASSGRRSEDDRYASSGRRSEDDRYASSGRRSEDDRYASSGRRSEDDRYASSGRRSEDDRYASSGRRSEDDRYASSGRRSEDDRYASSGRRSEDDRYASSGRRSEDDRYASSGRRSEDDRYASSGQGTRRGRYSEDEYYDQAPTQRPRQQGRVYAEQEDYDMPRARGAQGAAGRYDYDDLAEDNRADSSERSHNRRSDGYYRAPSNRTPSGRTAARSAQGGIGGILDWFNQLTSRQMTWMLIGVTGVILVIILLICLLMQSDSCTGCERGNNDIPVIEQGDGDEALGGQDFYYDNTTEVVSTGDGMITIDEELETDSFVVAVTGADGTYGRTDVSRNDAATLVVTNQNETGFEFSLDVRGEGVQGSLSGYAYFCGEKEAMYEGAQGRIIFAFGSNGITVYQMDIIEAFSSVSPDGIYVIGTPSYIEDEAEQSEFDANIRNSDMIKGVLSGMLSENDAALLEFIFQNGTERVFEGSEKGYDKNGTAINIDAELNAVKYCAFINGTGEEIVMICTNDGKVYVGICDGMEYRYYTNDPAYASTAPKAIAGQAQGRGLQLVSQQ